MSDCIFCKFAKGEIKPVTIYEDEKTLAFLDINPAGKLDGHTLIIPKNHFQTIEDIDEEDLSNLIKVTKKISITIKKYSGATGINIIQNNYKSAGQLVPHFHFHIIPRIENDGINFETKRRTAIKEKLEKVGEEIKKLI